MSFIIERFKEKEEASQDQLYKGKGDIGKSYNSFTAEVSLADVEQLLCYFV